MRIIGLITAVPLCVTLCAAQAEAATLLDVTGTGNAGVTLIGGEAVATSFTLGTAQDDVSISIDLLCVACTGSVLLTYGTIGTNAGGETYVYSTALGLGNPTDPLFGPLDLVAGTYFVIVAVDDGGVLWQGSDPATITGAAGVTLGLSLFAETLASIPFRSSFEVIEGSAALHLSLSQPDTGVAPVPVPPAAPLLAGGCLALLMFRPRRTTR